MKKLMLILAAALMAVAATAETKVLERSAKKAPDWISTAAEGYIVAAVEAPSIAEARTRAEHDIASQMVMAVARNISSSYTNESSEITTNAGVDSRDSYSSTVAVQGANLPFLKGISLSKAEDIYWVKVRDKGTKAEYYQYYVKYPFFRVEQQALIAEFEKYDAVKEAELEALEVEIDTVDSVDAIKGAIGRLEALQSYFFDKVRAAKVKALIARYRELTKSVSMSGAFADGRTLIVSFSLADHPFKVYGQLKATSNCAGDIQVVPSQGAYKVTFNSEYCLDDEENYIEVSTRVDGRKFAGKYAISAAAGASDRFAVTPTGKVVLTADSTDTEARTVSNINIRLSLNNRGGSAFGVKSLELELPTLGSPVIIDNIDAVYTSKGIVQLNVRYEGTVKASGTRRSAVSLASGTITLVNAATQAVERVKVALPYSANWEEK
ncbi:MAG: plethodontid receptivity factor PRF [Muribaculaceae bacterium]|nr:plethodontid receptivity factor PRF [Muribaculaceae bacterium]